MTRRLESSNHTLIALPLALCTLALVALAACAPPALAAPAATQAPPRRTLAVTGTATVDLVPDCLDVSLALSAEGARPKAAMSALRARQDVLTKALLAAGVAPGDVKLSGASVSPKYDSYNHLLGYVASIGVVASTKKLDLVGDIMEAASTAGTQSMSTAYRVSDLLAAKKKVRKMALEAAAEKAHETVDALGAHLGHVAEVSESANEYNPGAFGNAYVASPERSAQLGPESQPITLTINVVYELD